MDKEINFKSQRVCIGIPTYNRPYGLARTLNCLLNQTYKNFVILISDNFSPEDTTRIIAEKFALEDSRIHYLRQEYHIQAVDNFKFVLRHCAVECEFFMWAADDDEWSPTFLENCITALNSGAISAMTNFYTSYRGSGKKIPAKLPNIALTYSNTMNIIGFLLRPTPSLFYGVHRRSEIMFFLDDNYFDFYDCYLIIRLLTKGKIHLNPEHLYIAGIDEIEYKKKPVQHIWGSGLRVLPFYQATSYMIMHTDFSLWNQLVLLSILSFTVARISLVTESKALLQWLLSFVYRKKA